MFHLAFPPEKKFLLKHRFKKWIIISEPIKKNTSAAIASIVVLQKIFVDDPVIIFPSDHLIENNSKFYKSLTRNMKYLNDDDIFIYISIDICM